MILTAGLGTRLRPVTEQFAKPAVPFLNSPLFYYPFSLMEETGIRSLVLNTHHKPEQIEKLARNIPGSTMPVEFSPEPSAPLGTGGGIWKARKFLEGGGDFIVSNGDEVILPKRPGTMRLFLDAHRASRALATILVMKHPLVGTQFGGVWTEADGTVRGFGKDPAQFGEGLTGFHYIGILLLSDRIFQYLPEGESNILYDALTKAIAAGEKVRAFESNFTWFETGNPQDFLAASGEALRLLAGSSREDARTLARICRRFASKGTTLERQGEALVMKNERTPVPPGVQFKGFAVIGENCQIADMSVIDSSVLLPGSRVEGEIAGQIVLPD